MTELSLPAVLLVLGLLLAAPAPADDVEVFDSRAVEILKAFAEPLAAADAFSLDFSTEVEVLVQGQKDRLAATYRLTVKRPDRFLLELMEGDQGVNLSSDGTHLTLHLPPLKRYLQIGAPESLDDLFDQEDFLALLGMVTMEGLELLPAFLHSRPRQTLLKEVLTLEWLGEEEWEGQPVHRLRFTQEHFDWEILLSQESPSRLLYFEPDFAKVVKATKDAMPHLSDFSIHASTRYGNWRKDPPEPRFRLRIPEEDVKVDTAARLFGTPPAPQGPDASSLEGEPAPDFTLENLDGTSVTLSQLEGYRVLILDFWATWCGPCVAALPPLVALAEEYRDRGVRLLAVNQGETAERIRLFLQNQKLDTEVLLDQKNEVSRKYRVQGIPQTVIIDEKGVVRKVHIGYLPRLKQQLAAEIDALLRE